MSDAPAQSEYASARASLRDTVKWLVGVVSGVGALLASGISITALGSLTGSELQIALVLGLAAFAALMGALHNLMQVLLVKPFGEKELLANQDLCRRIAESGILPAGRHSVRDLIDTRRQALEAFEANRADAAAEKSFTGWQQESRRALDYGSFLDLSDRTRGALWGLAMFSVVIMLCTVAIGFLLSKADTDDAIAADAACGEATLRPSPAEVAEGTLQLTLPMDCARQLILRSLNDG